MGIDLGTTRSVIAHIEDGRPATIRNLEGELTTPSVVHFGTAVPVVGKEAVKSGLFEPQLTACYAKRDMGKAAYHQLIAGRRLPPEVVQALVLKKLKEDARLKLGEFHRAVITVPAFFNEPRRKATQDAGRLAGLEVLDIINEPTAAAIAYGVQQGFLNARGETRQPETILVYDLGGGTFDVTLMVIDGRNYKALATAGDVYLGGIDWDRRLVDFLAERFLEQHGVDLRQDPRGRMTLLREAEDAKHALTARADVTVYLTHEGVHSRIAVARREFESLTGELLQRTLFTVERLLRDVKCGWNDVTRLLLVGGSTRMPMVPAMLEEASGLQADRSLSPDEAVAHGAAIYADLLLGDPASRPDIVVTNVNSHDLGVLGVEPETGRPRRKILIARNTPLPAQGTGKFVTHKENQTNVVVRVVEGGDASGSHATHIGKCVVSDLPPGLPTNCPVVVQFCYAANGRLQVHARLPSVQRTATMTIERAAGLSEETLAQWERRIRDGLGLEIAEEEAAEAIVAEDDEFGGIEVLDDDSETPTAEASPSAPRPDVRDEMDEDGKLTDFLDGL